MYDFSDPRESQYTRGYVYGSLQSLMALMVDLRYTSTHKRDIMKHPFEEINAAPMMALNNRATSGDARGFIGELTALLTEQEHRKRQRKPADQEAFELALELIIGDLFSNHREDAAGWVCRSLFRNTFTGELVGHTTFTNSIALLEQAGLVERWQGGNIKTPSTMRTRMRPSTRG